MEFKFFYFSIASVILIFAVCIYFKPLRLSHVIIGMASVAYSILFDIILGQQFGLYYYISSQYSILCIVISGVFIYPLLNVIYTLFLPENRKTVFIYTGFWIAAMLLFEYLSLLFKTIVLTGWRVVPWSFVAYGVTYTWIFFFYRYVTARTKRQGMITNR